MSRSACIGFASATIVLLSVQVRSQQVDASTQGSGGSATQLQEVVVTAEKKTENLIDVPVPVTAIGAQSLLESNQLKLEDYFTQVPGLTVTPSGYGSPQLSIRGITTGGFVNPSVGITVDDVPYGSSSGIASGQEVTNFDPNDLQRIEVLRGPQGTFYGASALGGLVKYVTVDPSTAAVGGQVQAGVSDVYNGGEVGYNFRAALNVPINDTLAVRASAFYRADPGYIDNILTGQDHVDRAWADGAFVKALWQPSADFSVRLTALLQHSWSDGVSQAYSGLGDLQQSAVYGSGLHNRETQAYSATINAKLGDVNLTSVTGYSIRSFDEWQDYTSIYGPTSEQIFGVSGSPFFNQGTTYRFTQELRLNGAIGSWFDWLVGGYYNHEDSPASGGAYATVPETGEIVGLGVHYDYPSTYQEYAAFGDITLHFTDRIDLQLGAREGTNRQTYSEYDTGPFVPIFEGTPSPFVYPQVTTKDSSFTYLVTPRFKISPDTMLYARLASGYRPGGPNIQGNVDLVPIEYNPDKTRNYEVGVKSEVLDHRLFLDASVYYIKWDDIQLQLVNPSSGIFYYANGSEAKSQGLELAVQAKPLTGLSVSAWVAWNQAKLTAGMPAGSSVIGNSGDRLPYSAPFSGNLSVEQSFPLTSLANDLSGYVGASFFYIGDRTGQFASVYLTTPQRQDLPSYSKLDLRGGVDYRTWKVNVYVNNVTDRRGVLDGGLDLIPSNAYVYIQPRTVGVTVTKTF
jgi:iron complex outermembrane recepter protein